MFAICRSSEGSEGKAVTREKKNRPVKLVPQASHGTEQRQGQERRKISRLRVDLRNRSPACEDRIGNGGRALPLCDACSKDARSTVCRAVACSAWNLHVFPLCTSR
jgi:hypothetical protein